MEYPKLRLWYLHSYLSKGFELSLILASHSITIQRWIEQVVQIAHSKPKIKLKPVLKLNFESVPTTWLMEILLLFLCLRSFFLDMLRRGELIKILRASSMVLAWYRCANKLTLWTKVPCQNFQQTASVHYHRKPVLKFNFETVTTSLLLEILLLFLCLRSLFLDMLRRGELIKILRASSMVLACYRRADKLTLGTKVPCQNFQQTASLHYHRKNGSELTTCRLLYGVRLFTWTE